MQKQVLSGCCLIDKESVLLAIEELVPDDFYGEENKILFQCIKALFAKDIPIDIITVKDEVTSMGEYERVGGMAYIASLPDRVPTTANVGRYIKIVKDRATTRNLISMSNEISKMCFDPTVETEELSEFAEKKVFEVTQKKNIKGVSNLQDLLGEALRNLEDISKNGKRKGIPTGFIDVDRRMGGLKGSELIILAARPGMGKSAFVLNIATHVAENENIPVLIFNLEMGKEQLTDRIICSECLIDSKRYSEGKLEDEEWEKLAFGMSKLSKTPIYIDDNSSITMNDIKSKCRKMQMENNIGLVIIDYLQLITPNDRKQSREQEVAVISRDLKILAKDLNIPVIALSQLSRANEKRNTKEKRPVLSDLRDSGSIEQDADIVMFIHREGYYDDPNMKPEDKNIAEINIAKFRAGEPGTEKLLWFGQYTKFQNLQKGYD